MQNLYECIFYGGIGHRQPNCLRFIRDTRKLFNFRILQPKQLLWNKNRKIQVEARKFLEKCGPLLYGFVHVYNKCVILHLPNVIIKLK